MCNSTLVWWFLWVLLLRRPSATTTVYVSGALSRYRMAWRFPERSGNTPQMTIYSVPRLHLCLLLQGGSYMPLHTLLHAFLGQLHHYCAWFSIDPPKPLSTPIRGVLRWQPDLNLQKCANTRSNDRLRVIDDKHTNLAISYL